LPRRRTPRSRAIDQVLLVIGDAAEVFDAMYPLHRIREDGYQVVVAAPEKRVYHLVMHDTHPDWDITAESPSYKLASDIAFRDIRPEEYAGLVVSGSRAPLERTFPGEVDLFTIIRQKDGKGLVLSSMGHQTNRRSQPVFRRSRFSTRRRRHGCRCKVRSGDAVQPKKPESFRPSRWWVGHRACAPARES
jgi:hypothetical protein